jgi:G:T-mismatch repair DNA endonuclease (very short patch repair protein)
MGWDVLVLWECELRGVEDLRIRLQHHLGPPGGSSKSVRAGVEPDSCSVSGQTAKG